MAIIYQIQLFYFTKVIANFQILEKDNALKQEEEKQTADKLVLGNMPATEKKRCC